MNPALKNNTGIAIVGMAGRFPKAQNTDEFWHNLCNGVEAISFFRDEELEAAGVEFPKDDPNYVKARGLLADADLFDAAFFGITPREAEVMDPQHRVFLECAWEALANAGCDPAKFDGAIGVFAGMSMNTYLARNLLAHPELVAQLNEHQLMLGNDKDYLPTRVSYKLNLRGPSLNIQASCSTSLVAVCVACQNLLNYECDAALAGAVSVTFPQKRGYWFQEGGISSPDGHCRPFDAQAAGTVPGEGVAIVVLKRLADAIANGDQICAVIKGFAMNNDGANKIGYTAPGVEGQAEVIATAQAMAGFAPDTIGFIEAHGTGTPLGDPVEIEALAKAFRAGTNRKNFCAVGSVKGHVGHLDTAAGVTSLIKAALALHHQKIPPTLHFQSPNPKMNLTESPFFVNAKLISWENGETPRRAGVNSFGIGGTNAHIVLEEAPENSCRRELHRVPARPFERKRYFIEPPKPVRRTVLPAVGLPDQEVETAKILPSHYQQVVGHDVRSAGVGTARPHNFASLTAQTKQPIVAHDARSTDVGETKEPAMPKETTARSLRTLLHDLSGVNTTAISGDMTFAEMGFESLFLMQFCVAVEKKFGVRVAFRQLLEQLSTLDALASHIEHCCQHAEAPIQKPEMDRRTGNGSSLEDVGTVSPSPRLAGAEGPNGERAGVRCSPLTEAQRELWLASQINAAASCVYNECLSLQLRGKLEENALLTALQTLVDRHEALRTTFAPDGDLQQIQPALKLDVPLLNWPKLTAEAWAARLDELLREEARQPFDLTAGPLFRARLIRLEESLHVLVLTVHHLVCDGHSLGVLLRELAEIYSAARRGAPPESERRSPTRLVGVKLPVPPRWSEYALRQSQENPSRQTDGEFWLKQFAAGAPALELPADHPHSSSSSWTFDGAGASRLLPAALGAQLKRLSARRGATLFNTLLTAYGVLLHRLSGQDEIVIGIPVADRAMDNAGTLVGHCVNFLPLRLRFNAEETFEKNLVRTQKSFLDACDHPHCNFGRLLQELNLPRDSGRMPLASVTFNVQQFSETLKFDALETQVDANVHAFTHFDLSFDVTDLGDTLLVHCRHRKNLFFADTIRRWLGHFQTLLEGIAAAPSLPISRLPLLTGAEQNQIFVEWNGPKTDYPRDLTIAQLFEAQVEKTLDAVAVAFGEEHLTFGQLNHQANRLARHLQKLGVGAGIMAAVCLERSADLVVALLAILKAGGAYVPLDPAHPRERLELMLADLCTPVLLTQEKFRAQLDFQNPDSELNPVLVCLDTDQEAFAPLDSANLPSGAQTGSPAYVSFTSGSTGRPKGVVVPHRAVVRLVKETNYAHFGPDETFLQLAPVAFDASTFEIWGALLNGAKLVVFPPAAPSLAELGEFIRQNQITTLWLTAGLFHQMIEEQLENLAGLRQLLAGGDVLSPPHVKRALECLPGCKIINGYGPTENTTFTCCHELSPADCEGRSIPIGRPIDNTQVYVLDACGQPVPVGVPGELYAGGDGLALGYLNQTELTAEKFVPNPFADASGSTARLYKTGDLVRWLPDGVIEFLGRIDQQVKIRGFRVEPGEIETVLNRHPAVRECAVTVHGGQAGDKRIVAYVVPKTENGHSGFAADGIHGNGTVDVNASGRLRSFLQEKLPDYMIPFVFVLLPSLPLSANGKVDRRALPPPDPRWFQPAKPFVAPRNHVEKRLAGIWQEVLGVSRVGVEDHFFELGGNSLAAARLAARVEKVFGRKVPMSAVFESPTIAQLARCLPEKMAQSTLSIGDLGRKKWLRGEDLNL